ncbi:hypothetical protein [Sulfitobacter sp. S190]|uniref:hypothetical protein n=1 Tax=Sulfitobacter sp. S190 TaxID=2867022 RepID=UPI0021A796EA|nr:hypothetical protein [Sulfitobacter sp. S190]
MDFTYLWAEAVPIPAHALAALGALVLGAVQLAMPKGGRAHRWMGRLWVAMLGFVAASSFSFTSCGWSARGAPSTCCRC